MLIDGTIKVNKTIKITGISQYFLVSKNLFRIDNGLVLIELIWVFYRRMELLLLEWHCGCTW